MPFPYDMVVSSEKSSVFSRKDYDYLRVRQEQAEAEPMPTQNP